MSTPIGHRAALVAVYAERYVLAPIYLWFSWVEFHSVSSIFRKEYPILQFIWLEPFVTKSAVLAEFARHVVALLLNFFTCIFLLLGRRASVPPQSLRDIFAPLAAVSFVLTYNFVPWFPASMQKSLCPIAWQAPLIVTGLFLGVIGPWIAVWSILYLRRSFGIFVVVRKLVLGGPYKWVRHPMYLGYICMLAGIALINFSSAYFALVPIHIVLLIYRARLEEARLSEQSPEYREYKKHTGFIFPFRAAGSR